MSRYIKADDLKKEMDELEGWFKDLKWKVENLDADVVEVVRCEDCKWLDIYTINGEDITACNNENAFFRDVRCDEHCSCGERREDGEIH